MPARPSGDAGESLGRMSTDRPNPLPNEAAMDAQMAEMKAQLDAMRSEVDAAKAQYASAVAALGPPEVATYGKAIYDKLVSFRNAHPDLPGHFDAQIDAAKPLADASQAVIAGTGDVSAVLSAYPAVVESVDKFITKGHQRTASKPLDFSALSDDLYLIEVSAAKVA